MPTLTAPPRRSHSTSPAPTEPARVTPQLWEDFLHDCQTHAYHHPSVLLLLRIVGAGAQGVASAECSPAEILQLQNWRRREQVDFITRLDGHGPKGHRLCTYFAAPSLHQRLPDLTPAAARRMRRCILTLWDCLSRAKIDKPGMRHISLISAVAAAGPAGYRVPGSAARSGCVRPWMTSSFAYQTLAANFARLGLMDLVPGTLNTYRITEIGARCLGMTAAACGGMTNE